MRYSNNKRRKVRVGDKVWIETDGDTGRGTVVKVYKRTCDVEIGFDTCKGVKSTEIELEN
jgi:hypothetical protein